jgi:hypothetical protein
MYAKVIVSTTFKIYFVCIYSDIYNFNYVILYIMYAKVIVSTTSKYICIFCIDINNFNYIIAYIMYAKVIVSTTSITTICRQM